MAEEKKIVTMEDIIKKMPKEEEPAVISFDTKSFPKETGVKVMTPDELLASLPKKIMLKKTVRPKIGLIRAKFHWPGHFHDSDRDQIIYALEKAYPKYAFKLVKQSTGLFEVGGEYEVTSPVGGKSKLVIDGIHGYADVVLLWDIKDPLAVQKFFYASRIFEQVSGRTPVGLCMVNMSYEKWNLGGEWTIPDDKKPKLFIDQPDIATIYLSTEGNRDNYGYIIKIPPARWVFDLLKEEADYNKVTKAIWECREKILYPYALFTTVETEFERELLKKRGEKQRDLFGFTLKMGLDDMDFKPYEGIVSAIKLAEETKLFFDSKDVKIGGALDYPREPTTCPYCDEWAICPPEDAIVQHIRERHPEKQIPQKYKKALEERQRFFSKAT